MVEVVERQSFMLAHDDARASLAAHFDRFVFLAQRDKRTASLRIHFGALEAALTEAGVSVVSATPADALAVDRRTCLIYYYNDLAAIAAIRAGNLASQSGLSLCMGSDIKALQQYSGLLDIADGFVMPSAQHAETLGLLSAAPARTVREGIDPIAGGGGARGGVRGRQVAWFGYPESYYRGMRAFEPVIATALENGAVERFALITQGAELDPRVRAFPVIPFSTASFAQDLGQFSYALLSHAPGDLHLNSMIKSPNKVITALAAGLVPLATATPNYAALLEELGLQRFLFTSPMDLARRLERLDPQADADFVAEQRPLEQLQRLMGAQAILGDFVKVIEELAPQRDEIRQFVLACGGAQPRHVGHEGFRNSLRETADSFQRIVAKRLGYRMG